MDCAAGWQTLRVGAGGPSPDAPVRGQGAALSCRARAACALSLRSAEHYPSVRCCGQCVFEHNSPLTSGRLRACLSLAQINRIRSGRVDRPLKGDLSLMTTAKTKCPMEREIFVDTVDPERTRVVLLESRCLYQGVAPRPCKAKSVGKQWAKCFERQM